MIPTIARIRIIRATGPNIRLWLPLFVVWIIALPFVLLALPLVFIVLWAKKLNPFRTVGLVLNLIAGLRGTHLEASSDTESVLVRIY